MLTKVSKARMIVIGDVMLDVYFSGEVNRISPEAPVPVFWVRQKNATLGGAGNVALNLAKLGCCVYLFGVRGHDPHGERMSSIVRDNGIHDCLIVDHGHITTTKTRIIGERQQLIRLDEEETWECGTKYQKKFLENIKKFLNRVDGVILSDYSKGVLTGAISQQIIKLCKVRGLPVFVDPKRKGWARYTGATCVTPNIAEIEEVSGLKIGYDPDILVKEGLRLKNAYQFKWVLATRGRAGMCLIEDNKKPAFINSAAQEVFDVSGAGDTVIATFAAAASGGIPPKLAAEISNLAAGIVVGKVGSQPITIMELESAWKSRESGMVGAHSHKITTLHSAQLRIQTWKAVGEKIVVTHGFFDTLNPSIIQELNNSRSKGDHLIVVVYSDSFAKKSRFGDGLIFKQKDRADLVSAIQSVDLVVLLEKGQFSSMIEVIKPDVLISGGQNELEITESCKKGSPRTVKL